MTAELDLVDIGANLADRSFDGDRDAVIERARAHGVRRMVVTGSDVAQSHRALEVARARPGVLWSTAGVHPHHARNCDEATVPALRSLLAEPEVVAVGEFGLDFFRDLSPRAKQIEWCEAQLALAAEVGMPAFVHERDASDAMLGILAEWRARIPAAVVHCFTGNGRALRGYLDLDLHIGITGWICDERRGTHLRPLVAEIPADRLMLETDSPYLLPRTIRPRPKTRRNEPMWLGHVVEAVAAARGETPAIVAEATSATASRFFALDAESGTD